MVLGFRSRCHRPSSFISPLEAVEDWGPRPLPGLCSGQLQPMRVMLFVMRNLNREQQWGMTGMCFHWRELHTRKREQEKKEEEETLRHSCVKKERLLGPKRKTNVIVHWLSLCQPSLTNWFLVSLPVSPPPLSPSLSLLPLDSVCSGGQWHSSEWAPVVPPSARMVVDCHQVRVRRGLQRAGSWSSNPGSFWLGGSRKSREKQWEEQNKNGEKLPNVKNWGEWVA